PIINYTDFNIVVSGIVDFSKLNFKPEIIRIYSYLNYKIMSKIYRALLTQSGTDAPVATILQNALPVVPTFTYVSPGVYNMAATGIFVQNKTGMLLGACANFPFSGTQGP